MKGKGRVILEVFIIVFCISLQLFVFSSGLMPMCDVAVSRSGTVSVKLVTLLTGLLRTKKILK